MSKILSTTKSVCPECLTRIPARRVQDGDDIYLEKTCPAHGSFRTIIWRGKPAFTSWVRPKTPSYPENPFTEIDKGCPYDCGLCPKHRQHTCSVLLEVTMRCDLSCPVCFADAAHYPPPDMTIAEIKTWFDRLIESGGPFNIQLSGGEPCLRDDLPDIIQLGRSMGFQFFQVNTNGLRLSEDIAFLAKLKTAGLSTVFLQFDGTNEAIYKSLRGRRLLESKLLVIENCKEQGIGVVLVPTLVPGINTDDVGNILHLALERIPTVRGVHFQPISYFGRYPQAPCDDKRITIPEVIQAIDSQTSGVIPAMSFCPPGCENALCSFHGNFVEMPDGQLIPLTHHVTDSCCCQPIPAAQGAAQSRGFVAKHWSSAPLSVDLPVLNGPSLGEWDGFLERIRTHTFCVSGMAFQDAWTLDLDRLHDCCIHCASPDGRLVPFCAYNLTDRQGLSLYRQIHAANPA
jgi:uncharacterized radical SAM superfamily Fe-S cluster-containing enzyme